MEAAQHSLPRLPVPPLHQTLQRYLWHAKELAASPEEWAATKAEVEAFGSSAEAQTLHGRVVEWAHDPGTANWLERHWLGSYLRIRKSPGVFVSPVCASPRWEATNRELVAAHTVRVAVGMHLAIQGGTLSPDLGRGGAALCMNDYRNFFGSATIPGRGCNRWTSAVHGRGLSRATPRHIVVFCHGLPYTLDVVAADGSACLPVAQLYAAIRGVAEDAARRSVAADPQRMVGAVTAMDREDWAALRDGIMAAPGPNARAVELIEAALFVLTLDDGTTDAHTAAQLHTLEHGLPTEDPCAVWRDPARASFGRWWDKSVHVHVSHACAPGLTFEHTAFDAFPVTRLLALFAAEGRRLAKAGELASPGVAADPSLNDETPPLTVRAVPLAFDLTPALTEGMEKGRAALLAAFGPLDLAAGTVPGCGVAAAKAVAVNPDAYAQLAMQVAFQAVRGHVPSTYEAASTKGFLHGRTETLRVVNPTSQRFVDEYRRCFGPGGAPRGDETPAALSALAGAVRAASAAHTTTTRAASSGNGCDRHLTALQCAAAEMGVPLPAMFRSAAWRRFETIELSTTRPQSGAPGAISGTFGPVSPRCVGVVYFIFGDHSAFGVSTWREGPTDRSSQAFLDEVGAVMRTLGRVLKLCPAPVERPASKI